MDLIEFIREWYPRLREQLWTDETLKTDAKIDIFLRHKDENDPEALAHTTSTDSLIIYDGYLKGLKHKSGGLIIHELTHLLQSRYRQEGFRRPIWISEALADYQRFTSFEAFTFEMYLKRTSEAIKHKNIEKHFIDKTCVVYDEDNPCPTFWEEGYSYSYQPIHTAGMLVMIEHRFPGTVKKIHRRMHDSVKDSFDFFNKEFSDYLYSETGKGLQQNWCEYLAYVDNKTEEEVLQDCLPKVGWLWRWLQ
ncbi:hypothetical protein [Parendozoicomonas sp. Alg238-R29]|uniref:hypothetical protein n=1 Tax=Parendozoicomonas sp. Alg238-R29 TaxID=2993446 RepID=UPI00248E2618|nr:hypothetical protein [Parendozoicomonas sp. Alg238-R29]